MKICVDGSGITSEAGRGESILAALARAGVMLDAPCGGSGRCGKCRVRIVSGQVSGATEDNEGYVLACLARPESDVVIAIADNAFAGGALGVDAIGADAIEMDAIERLPHGIVAAGATSGRFRERGAGIALDIGTTTVSARLLELTSSGPAVPIDTLSQLNDQRAFGADVMSRIAAARNGKTQELFAAVNNQTERIIRHFRERWGFDNAQRLVVSGNTTMLHLFCNVDPSPMGVLPFTPAFLEAREIAGEDLALSADTVTVLPSISAFVGADVTAAIAALGLLNSEGPCLLVDIGTNGEMALVHSGKILCCSTAAGPAFEGAEISSGTGGIPGAINAVDFVDGRLSIKTIGGERPRGICGSGLVDAIAMMLAEGIIDEGGHMEAEVYPQGFPLAAGVSITGRDVRQFQLAKSAIFSGMKILCKHGGIKLAGLKKVYIAGGFGFYINPINASRVGLLPREILGNVFVAGNVSLRGAEEAFSRRDFLKECAEVSRRARLVDLSADKTFMDEFVENMLFE